MICASEDVGNADPQALQVAVAAAQAVERVGMLGNDVHFFLSIFHGVLRERVCICLDINALFIFTQSTSGSVTADIKIIFVD